MAPKQKAGAAPAVEGGSKKRPAGAALAALADLPEGQRLDHNQAVAVTDRLKQLAREGNAGAWVEYKQCRGHAAKRDFAVKPALDPQARWAKAVDNRTVATCKRSRSVSGELALWEIAKIEGLPFTDDNKVILQGLVEGCPSRPHPKPALAAAGHLIYDYSKKMAGEAVKDDSHALSLTKETWG